MVVITFLLIYVDSRQQEHQRQTKDQQNTQVLSRRNINKYVITVTLGSELDALTYKQEIKTNFQTVSFQKTITTQVHLWKDTLY